MKYVYKGTVNIVRHTAHGYELEIGLPPWRTISQTDFTARVPIGKEDLPLYLVGTPVEIMMFIGDGDGS